MNHALHFIVSLIITMTMRMVQSVIITAATIIIVAIHIKIGSLQPDNHEKASRKKWETFFVSCEKKTIFSCGLNHLSNEKKAFVG